MASPEDQKLDLYFKEDLSAIFSLSFLYGPNIREMIKQWTTVFYTMGSNVLDKQMRNRYTSYLLMQLEVNRNLSRPFNEPPPEHISEPLAKVVSADEYIRFFEKCEKFYLSKKHHIGGGDDEPFQEHRMSPSEFLYRMPPISDGLVAYGACFSKAE